MKTLFTCEDEGEVLDVTDTEDGLLEIGVAIGEDWYDHRIEEGDCWFAALDESEVEALVVALDQWLLERRAAREQAEDHLPTY